MSPKEHFRIYVAAYLLLLKDDKVLLLKRENTGYQDGNYSLVAGHLDGNETAKECIIRETKEEADIYLSGDDLKIVHVMHRLTSSREYIDIYLLSEKWKGEIKNLEPEKCSDLSWFSIKKLPLNIVPEVKFAIEKLGDKILYTEFGWAK